MKAAFGLSMIVLAGLGAAAFFTGYGWLLRDDRWPPALSAKGGGTCRYQTVRGIRIAYYHGPCPRFSTTNFPDKRERF